jgi:hypothetical protein
MKHVIKDDIYYLYSDDETELLNIKLTDLPEDQIIITTNSEVYAGPVKFIRFSDDQTLK